MKRHHKISPRQYGDQVTLYCVAGCTPAIRDLVRMCWLHPEHIVVDARSITGRARMQELRERQAARAMEQLQGYLAND